ncbi:MAG: hypothetical protein HYV99_02330 [Betaproteobacteria bacterium]|nr:hypothetical protein [Betaproteobacteria bacterium]
MLNRSRRSFIATARWILAIWVAFVASSAVAPCKEAFALPRQGEQAASYAMSGAKHAAHEHALFSAGEARIPPSDSSYCVVTPNPIPLKAHATSTPTSAGFLAAVASHNLLIFKPAPAARMFTLKPAAPPQVLLQTSRLLI